MKIRKKTTYTATKFEIGMEDGETYSNLNGCRLKYIRLTNGEYAFIKNENDCYIVKNDFNGTFELMNGYQLKSYYEEIGE